MISWDDPTPALHPLVCALCGCHLYPEELADSGLAGDYRPWGPLCGVCQRRADVANLQSIMEHFAGRLRARGHRVDLSIDGRRL